MHITHRTHFLTNKINTLLSSSLLTRKGNSTDVTAVTGTTLNKSFSRSNLRLALSDEISTVSTRDNCSQARTLQDVTHETHASLTRQHFLSLLKSIFRWTTCTQCFFRGRKRLSKSYKFTITVRSYNFQRKTVLQYDENALGTRHRHERSMTLTEELVHLFVWRLKRN